MVRWFQRCMGGLVLLVAFAAAAEAAGERVTFPGAGPTAGVTLSATLYRAPVPGRGAAVVVLHTCAGITPFEEDWAAWFAAHGYHALVADSFKPRFVVSVCLHPGAPTPNDRAFDALGALAWLRTQPEVDPTRIGAIGWSHGGGAALAADVPLMVANAGVAGGGFRAVAALYPVCRTVRTTALAAPLLLLMGGKDEWTPPSTCDDLVAGLAPGGPAVTRYAYPEATHAFDNPRSDGHRVSANGAMFYLRYDSSAAADAHARVAAFFGAMLK